MLFGEVQVFEDCGFEFFDFSLLGALFAVAGRCRLLGVASCRFERFGRDEQANVSDGSSGAVLVAGSFLDNPVLSGFEGPRETWVA